MDLRQLEYFKSVAQYGSMSAAAGKLFVSQPTLSISVKKLEDELGLELFVRNGKMLDLTKAGKRVLEYADNILSSVDALINETTNLKIKKSKYLSIQSSGITMLKHFLLHYGKNNILPPPENYSIESEETIRESLLNGFCDIGFTSNPITDPQVEYMLLCKYRTMVNVPVRNPLSKLKGIHLSQLNGQKVLDYETTVYDPAIANLDDLLVKHGVDFERVFIPPDEDLFEFILDTSDEYISFYNSIIEADKSQETKGRKLIPILDKEATLTYYVNYLKENNDKVSRIRSWIRTDYKSLLQI